VKRYFELAELQAFLRLVDEQLSGPCRVVIVGPTALSLGYWPKERSFDIELWRNSDSALFAAAERAGEKLLRSVRIHQPLAGEPHHKFEDRLQAAPLEGLSRLEVLIPEVHDLALINAARGDSLKGLAELHASQPLSLQKLVERFHEMKREVSWPRARFTESFVGLIARLFGPKQAATIEKRL
jgi:hypothetical protein